MSFIFKYFPYSSSSPYVRVKYTEECQQQHKTNKMYRNMWDEFIFLFVFHCHEWISYVVKIGFHLFIYLSRRWMDWMLNTFTQLQIYMHWRSNAYACFFLHQNFNSLCFNTFNILHKVDSCTRLDDSIWKSVSVVIRIYKVNERRIYRYQKLWILFKINYFWLELKSLKSDNKLFLKNQKIGV